MRVLLREAQDLAGGFGGFRGGPLSLGDGAAQR